MESRILHGCLFWRSGSFFGGTIRRATRYGKGLHFGESPGLEANRDSLPLRSSSSLADRAIAHIS